MKIAVIGADGQLGTDLCKIIPAAEQIPLTIKDIDITNREQAGSVIRRLAPEAVINTAAYHQVDACEDNEVPAFTVNTIGVKYLAQACREVGAAMVHISTDYVFNGEKDSPYSEDDLPNPLSLYGVSKLAGEHCVRYLLKEHYVIRSSGLYGAAGCLGKGGGNFVENMIKRAQTQSELKVVTDEVLSPTYTFDLAKKIYELIGTRRYGLYHVTNQGACSWHDFTVEIFKLLGKGIKINRTVSTDFKTKARRPKYSALSNDRLKAAGLAPLRPWQEALKAYLLEKGHASRSSS